MPSSFRSRGDQIRYRERLDNGYDYLDTLHKNFHPGLLLTAAVGVRPGIVGESAPGVSIQDCYNRTGSQRLD